MPGSLRSKQFGVYSFLVFKNLLELQKLCNAFASESFPGAQILKARSVSPGRFCMKALTMV